MRRAFTLIELLVALSLSMVLIGSISTAFFLTLQYSQNTPERLNDFQDRLQIRRTLENLIVGTYVSTDENDLLTYFVAGDSTGQSATADSLTFTTLSNQPEGGFLISDSEDFEELQERFGPQGGVAEVSLSLTPVGSPNEDDSGLFLRIQDPSDGDTTQGGTERLLIPGVTSITFEMWDGGAWVQTWDTINGGSRRIPPAVRFTLEYEEGPAEYLTFRLPNSDVTAENPITQTGGENGP